MRVIGGVAKRKKLVSCKGSVRPTTDRIKETLFNLLGDIEGKHFLDLFAGTGSIGIEAASRGASSVYFVEKSYSLCKIIKENLILTGFKQKGNVFQKELKKNLFKTFKDKGICFDIIFADPPYEKGIVKELFNIIDFDIIEEGGFFVLQHSIREKGVISPKREVKIGDTLLSFYERNNQ